MAYSDFTLTRLEQDFSLQIRSERRLFADALPAIISNLLREYLTEYTTLALEIGTEKARSEFLIAPILAEIHRQENRQISLFSGTEFNVAPGTRTDGILRFFAVSLANVAGNSRAGRLYRGSEEGRHTERHSAVPC